MRSFSREILLFGGLFAALGLLSAGFRAGSAQPAESGATEASGAPEEPGPPTEPFAEPRALLESAWLVSDEAAGSERLVSGPQPPGARERVYTARFRYEGDSTAGGLQITVAIPADIRYVADSAMGPGARISYSVDGGRNFAPPGELSLPAEPDDPQSPARRARADDYTHIRWYLPGRFLPGTAGLVSFRARTAEPGPEAEPEAEPEPGPEPRADAEAAAPAGNR